MTSHLEADHVWASESDKTCTVCGYSIKDDYEYRWDVDTVECEYGDCDRGAIEYHRLCATNGVEIAEADRGPWETTGKSRKATCHYPKLNVSWYCACPTCEPQSGKTPLYSDCYCSHLENGELLIFTESIMSGSYHLRYNGNGAKKVDFSDPVYEVEADVFDEAFINMTNLTTVSAHTITNVGDRAFRRAFTNDVNLTIADFSGVVTAGEDAFLGAFTGTKVASLDFKSLEDGDIDCFDTSNIYATAIIAPVLRYGYIVVSNMPNLAVLNVSNVDYNIISDLPDLAKLSGLRTFDISSYRYDAHNNLIPPFKAGDRYHAPVDAMRDDFMVVVPNELLEDWRAADGWNTIYKHIVPVSNQVVAVDGISLSSATNSLIWGASHLLGSCTVDVLRVGNCYTNTLTEGNFFYRIGDGDWTGQDSNFRNPSLTESGDTTKATWDFYIPTASLAGKTSVSVKAVLGEHETIPYVMGLPESAIVTNGFYNFTIDFGEYKEDTPYLVKCDVYAYGTLDYAGDEQQSLLDSIGRALDGTSGSIQKTTVDYSVINTRGDVIEHDTGDADFFKRVGSSYDVNYKSNRLYMLVQDDVMYGFSIQWNNGDFYYMSTYDSFTNLIHVITQ